VKCDSNMQLIRGIQNLKPEHRGCVATIGNFDGVHLGHQQILKHVKQQAQRLSLPSLVVLFEPHPKEMFLGDKAPARLMRLREKVMAIDEHGIDRVLCIRFSKKLASLSPDEFVKTILIDGLDVKHLTVGHDFHFGKQRAGNFALLQKHAAAHDFAVESLPAFNIAAERVSSTRIRAALQQGDIKTAETLLGRPFGMSGRVAHGNKHGRKIGFPTANIHLHRQVVQY